MIGAIIGSIIGIIGGVVGTYFFIKKAQGAREKAYAIRFTIIVFLIVIGYLVCQKLIPGWYDLLLVVPYVVILILLTRKWNQTLSRIRDEDSCEGA